jgi:hypothetical protein
MLFADPPEEQQTNNLSNSTLRRKLFNGDIFRQAAVGATASLLVFLCFLLAC